MVWAIVVLILVGLDQVSKWYIFQQQDLFRDMVIIPRFFHLTYVENRGAAFSILQNARWFFVVMTVFAVIAMVIFLVKNHNTFVRITLALLIGGAIGNWIDRVRIGFVVDFFNFYIFGYDFPVFNVADIAVTIGSILLFVYMLFIYQEPVKTVPASESTSGDVGEEK